MRFRAPLYINYSIHYPWYAIQNDPSPRVATSAHALPLRRYPLGISSLPQSGVLIGAFQGRQNRFLAGLADFHGEVLFGAALFRERTWNQAGEPAGNVQENQ
ncbi:hypothetical protein TRIP_B200577 [uncultured Desulfatiglans sp.]|nr:hypothetical protein TRIP_B200577 [uncultured Desulfatiglans sp.]